MTEPLDAWFGDFAVRLVDVSATGAMVEHDEPVPEGARGLLRFYWRGEELEIMAETARAAELTAGLRFLEDSDALCRMIALSATEMLRALEANARGDRDRNVIGDETITSAWRRPATGFVRWLFAGGKWNPEPSNSPAQPEEGFTIGAGEPEEQVELLRKTYEAGDTESRQLTRIFAELSVASAG